MNLVLQFKDKKGRVVHSSEMIQTPTRVTWDILYKESSASKRGTETRSFKEQWDKYIEWLNTSFDDIDDASDHWIIKGMEYDMKRWSDDYTASFKER